MGDSISTFLSMGGYAAFVWPAFGTAAVVLVGLLITSMRTLRANQVALEALQAAGGDRRHPHTNETHDEA